MSKKKVLLKWFVAVLVIVFLLLCFTPNYMQHIYFREETSRLISAIDDNLNRMAVREDAEVIIRVERPVQLIYATPYMNCDKLNLPQDIKDEINLFLERDSYKWVFFWIVDDKVIRITNEDLSKRNIWFPAGIIQWIGNDALIIPIRKNSPDSFVFLLDAGNGYIDVAL